MKPAWMQLSFGALMLVLMFMVSGVSAFAQGGGGGGGGGNGRLEFFLSSGYISFASSAKAFDLSPGANYKIMPNWNWLQLGGEITYQKLAHQGGSTSSMVIMVGPTVNFGASSGDSTFISLGFAMRSGSTDLPDPGTDDPNGSGFYFIAGKRIPLSGALSLRPSMGVVNAGVSAVVIRPLALSLIF